MTDAALPISLGKAVLDLERGTLSVGGSLVEVRSKTFHLLGYLARNPGRVLGKDEIMDAVWPNVIVTEDSLTQCIRDARRAIGDEEQAVIRTVPRRGYLLVATGGPARSETAGTPPGSPGAVPSLAVLRFRLDAGASQLLPDEALPEEIASAIARFRSIAVIAPASVSTLPTDGDPAGLAARLGADYCVIGSAALGAGLDVRVELIEVGSRRSVWSDRLSVDVEKASSIPAEVAIRIVGRLASVVETDAARRAAARPAASARGFAHLFRGLALLRSYGVGVNEAAIEEFRAAIACDPDYGLAHAYLGLAEIARDGFQQAPAAVLDTARDRALKAVVLAPDEARCHRILGVIELFRKEHAAAEACFRRAIELNPYDADTLMQLGYLRATRGEPVPALALMSEAERLNPIFPDWYHLDRSVACYLAGRYRESAEAIEAISRRSAWQDVRRAAAWAMAGDAARAARALAAALAAVPALDPIDFARTMELERAEDIAHFERGMAAAIAALGRGDGR